MGLTHDGDLKAGNQCEEEVEQGTIMAPTVTATFNRFTWSSCSKNEFHKLVKLVQICIPCKFVREKVYLANLYIMCVDFEL